MPLLPSVRRAHTLRRQHIRTYGHHERRDDGEYGRSPYSPDDAGLSIETRAGTAIAFMRIHANQQRSLSFRHRFSKMRAIP